MKKEKDAQPAEIKTLCQKQYVGNTFFPNKVHENDHMIITLPITLKLSSNKLIMPNFYKFNMIAKVNII